MSYSLFFKTDATILCIFLFVGCIFMVRFARFLRVTYFSNDLEESRGGVNALLGALFGFWGFILAFTFGNASSRFDLISNTIVDESSAIRNVILRSELLPDSIGEGFRADMKDYIQARVDYYRQVKDIDKFNQSIQDTRAIGKDLWAKTKLASTLPNMGPTTAAMFASLTTMFDFAAKRDALLLKGLPELIFYLLFFLALVISFTGGFTTPKIATKEWVVIVGFISLACIIIFITIDLSRPMRGFIRPDAAEYRLEQLAEIFLQQ